MTMNDVTSLIGAGFKARKAFRNWRNRVRARKGEAPKGVSMKGFKTYTGILIAALGFVLGLLGLGDVESAQLSAQIVAALNEVLTVGGLAFAAYGRAKAQPKA